MEGAAAPLRSQDSRATAELLVTGSSGFIGSHLHTALARRASAAPVSGLDIKPSLSGCPHVQADIRDLVALGRAVGHVPSAIHLAAIAEVAVPFLGLAELAMVNVGGTANVLQTATPQRFIFTSSSAVYGSLGGQRVASEGRDPRPIGSYGASKAFAEFVCRDWAASTGGTAVILRLGNVIGHGCRGLIPFLVRHALHHADSEIAAECRGGGVVVRDYVPVGYVVGAIIAALTLSVQPGTAVTFNVGTGRPLTNRDVAAVVQRVLRTQGYDLRIRWDRPLLPGEAASVVLDVGKSTRTFGVLPPDVEETVATIEEATRFWQRAYEEARNAAPDAYAR